MPDGLLRNGKQAIAVVTDGIVGWTSAWIEWNFILIGLYCDEIILAPAPFLLYDFLKERLRRMTRLRLVYFFL